MKPDFIHLLRRYFGKTPTDSHPHTTPTLEMAGPLAACWVFKLQNSFDVTPQNAFDNRVSQLVAREKSLSGINPEIPEPRSPGHRARAHLA